MGSIYCTTIVRLFIATALVVLGISAIAKLISASGESRILGFPDPLLGFISRRQAMVMAAMVEAAIIVLVRREMDVARKVALIAWISSVFAVYRMGLWWVGYTGSCGCLGNLADALGISAAAADWVMKLTLTYLVAGSYAILAWMAAVRLRSLRPGCQAYGT